MRVENVLTFQVSLPERRYSSDAQVWTFYDRLLDRLTHLTGVRNAAVMSGRLPERRANNTTFFLEGVPVEGHMGLPQVEYIQHVSPTYFSTLQIPVLKGRSFTAADSGTSQPVAVVNETLARKFWPGRDPLGQRLRPAMQDSPWFTVIGVVADVKHAGIAAPVGTELYVAHRQARVLMSAWLPTSLHVVVAADTSHLLPIRQELQSLTRGIDSAAAIANIRLLQDSMSLSIAGPRFLAGSLGTFAAIAVILACVGIYGVVAYGVSQRTTEFGVRTALGATGHSIVSLVLAQAALPIGARVVLGFAGNHVFDPAHRQLSLRNSACRAGDGIDRRSGSHIRRAARVLDSRAPRRPGRSADCTERPLTHTKEEFDATHDERADDGGPDDRGSRRAGNQAFTSRDEGNCRQMDRNREGEYRRNADRADLKPGDPELTGSLETGHGDWAVVSVNKKSADWIIAVRTPDGLVGTITGRIKEGRLSGDWDFKPRAVGTFEMTRPATTKK